MKDYYYILGIKQNASTEEIKTAYRKLSLKFHPDVNKGDDFFTERFKEIQEAYETLLNNTSRSNYDNIKSNRPESGQPENKPNFTPYIEYFESNKLSFEFDEEITFSWKSINSDRVTIKPFGIVPPIGQKTYKLKNFKDATLTFELIAENLNINKTAKSTLVLKNKTYQDLYNHFKNEIEKDISRSSSKSHEHKENYNNNQNTNEKHKNSFSEYLKRRGQKIVAEVEILNGNKLVFCLPIETHNSIVEGCEVYINEKNALDGIYKSKNNKRYEVDKGILKDEFLIEIFKQNNGTEIEIDCHRMRGIAKGSRVWLNDYPAPNGTYKKGMLSKVQVIDGKIEKIF